MSRSPSGREKKKTPEKTPALLFSATLKKKQNTIRRTAQPLEFQMSDTQFEQQVSKPSNNSV
jgi:hypothetical protein